VRLPGGGAAPRPLRAVPGTIRRRHWVTEGTGRFRGDVRFRQPTGGGVGWVIFYEESSAGGGGILQATAVRVQFATPAPRILAVTTSRRLVD
jgi:hypothetical protein